MSEHEFLLVNGQILVCVPATGSRSTAFFKRKYYDVGRHCIDTPGWVKYSWRVYLFTTLLSLYYVVLNYFMLCFLL